MVKSDNLTSPDDHLLFLQQPCGVVKLLGEITNTVLGKDLKTRSGF